MDLQPQALRRLPRAFYARNPVVVAQELLGMVLSRALPSGRRVVGRIVETEAYGGRGDRASHAHRGKTPRNAVMFGPPGHAYVYFTYGMHWLLNVVTGPKGTPAAVLIRGVELIPQGHPEPPRRISGRLDGPAKLTKALRITGVLNGEDLVTSQQLWLSRPVAPVRRTIQAMPRIGVDYAGPAARWRRRFLLQT